MNPKDLIKDGIYTGKKLLFPKKSIQLILDNLLANEEILIVAGGNGFSTAGALAITNQRVIFASKILQAQVFEHFDVIEARPKNRSNILADKITIAGDNHEITVSSIGKKNLAKIIEKIDVAMEMIAEKNRAKFTKSQQNMFDNNDASTNKHDKDNRGEDMIDTSLFD